MMAGASHHSTRPTDVTVKINEHSDPLQLRQFTDCGSLASVEPDEDRAHSADLSGLCEGNIHAWGQLWKCSLYNYFWYFLMVLLPLHAWSVMSQVLFDHESVILILQKAWLVFVSKDSRINFPKWYSTEVNIFSQVHKFLLFFSLFIA